jgi:hypothetical protein
MNFSASGLPSGPKQVRQYLEAGTNLPPKIRMKRTDRKFGSNAERQAAYRNRKVLDRAVVTDTGSGGVDSKTVKNTT